jgi:hypothetical protein
MLDAGVVKFTCRESEAHPALFGENDRIAAGSAEIT